MKKLFMIILVGLGLYLSPLMAQPEPIIKSLPLTAGMVLTDSVYIPSGYVPVSVRVLDVTNVTAVTLRLGYGKTPSVFYTMLEVDQSTSYLIPVADSALGRSEKDKWLQLEVNAAEATDIVFEVEFRYF
jgi:hypothetical protein